MMMDASLPADESGLSDLSAASITSIGQQYIGPPSPSIDTHPSIAPTTPMPGTVRAGTGPYANATPGPSRIITDKADRSGAAWTPSPDASSRSKTSNRSILRSPSRNGIGNESMGSSLGTFDYSNASFSESFLRQAGAHMLAGLDEADLPPAASSSSSPRYRTSSSPTVTARPIRAADPRIPFTGKSLRTRMAEAGVIDSPASSDGSSPATSPTARMLPDSHTRSISYQPDVEQHSPQIQLDSSQVNRSSTAYSPSVHGIRYESASSPLRHQSPTPEDSYGMNQGGEWQEGLSVVPEESYVEDASLLPPMAEDGALRRSVVLGDCSSQSWVPDTSLELIANTPSSVPAPEQSTIAGGDAFSSNSTPSSEETPANDSASSPASLSSTKPEQDSDASSSRSDSARPAQLSPRSSPAPPATPQTAPRAINTPRSFARLRVGTPVRSSPLSRVVNFSSASSASGASQWQSPVNHRGHDEVTVSSPLASTGETKTASLLQEDASPAKGQRTHALQMSPASFQSLDTNREEHASHPQTPSGSISAQQSVATPSHLWSPLTSASFATPASQRPQQPSAPATPAFSQPYAPKQPASLTDAFTSPAPDFGTPQWSPSPAPVSPISSKIEPVHVDQDNVNPETSLKEPFEAEQEEALSSSACSSTSSASEKKQSGDVSTSSQPAVESRKKKQLDLPFVSTTQQHDSPSAARFSRMQLSRVSPPTTIPSELAAIPELGLVASAFDSLSHLSDSRVSRLVSQLSASTARIEELEAALEAREHDQAELQEVKVTLSQLSLQYQELVQEADAKDAAMEALVKKLQEQLGDGEGAKVAEMERRLEEERRLREVDRRDYEVRIQALMNSNPATAMVAKEDGLELATSGDDQMQTAIEQAKEHLRATLEKDFDVRRSMEQRELQSRIETLERELSTRSSTDPDTSPRPGPDLQRQIDQLTTDLDRRFEELADLREELESTTLHRDRAEERIVHLQDELEQAQLAPHDLHQLQEEIEDLQFTLTDRQMQIDRLEETLQLTNARLATVCEECETLAQQHEQLSKLHSDTEARMVQLEGHILTPEGELRNRTPAKPAPAPATTANTSDADTAPTTPANRLHQLERQLASLQLDLLKLGKANDALQQDNVNFSIALSAKQLELGMVKRNARFALKNAHAQGKVGEVGLPKSKVLQEKLVEFPKVPRGELGGKVDEGEKENVQVQVNQARMHARQMLALRRAAGGGVFDGGSGGQELRRQRQMMAA